MFYNFNSECFNVLDMRNLQEGVKKAFCLKLYLFTFHCSNKLIYSYNLQILGFQPHISRVFLNHQKISFIIHSRLEQFWKQNTIFLKTFRLETQFQVLQQMDQFIRYYFVYCCYVSNELCHCTYYSGLYCITLCFHQIKKT